MSDYKVVFRTDAENAESGITWERGCPLLLEAVQVSRNTETGAAFLQTKIRNLSASIVESFHMELTCTYQDGSSETFETEPLDADIPPCGEHTPKPVKLAKGNAVRAWGRILSANGSQSHWQSSSDPEPLPLREKLELSSAALRERTLQLGELGCSKASDAAPYACVEQDRWTQCAPAGRSAWGWTHAHPAGSP